MATDEVSSKKPAPRRRRRSANDVPAADAPAPWVAEDGAAIAADRVEVSFGAVGRVETRELDVDRGAVGAARAEHVSLQRGAIGAAVAGDVDIRQSFARSILAREVRVDQSFARTILAQEVHVDRSSFVGILLAQHVVGEVKVLLDWRGALALGAAAGLVMRILGRGRRTRG